MYVESFLKLLTFKLIFLHSVFKVENNNKQFNLPGFEMVNEIDSEM